MNHSFNFVNKFHTLYICMYVYVMTVITVNNTYRIIKICAYSWKYNKTKLNYNFGISKFIVLD